jgi:hypothetical protein
MGDLDTEVTGPEQALSPELLSSWYNPSWTYRVPVTVANNNVSQALVQFQTGISLTGAAYTAFHAHAKADGSDLVVTDASGNTTIPFALELYDATNSIVTILVKVPLIAGSGSTTVYLYYGNAAASSTSSYATTVQATGSAPSNVDIATQTNAAGYNDLPRLILFKYQDQPNGGGSGLNGKILAFMNVGANGNPGTTGRNIATSTSSDGGNTWSALTTIATPAAGNTIPLLGVCELTDGTLVIVCTYDTIANFSNGLSAQYCYISTDGGAHWKNGSNTGTTFPVPPTNRLTVPWTVGTTIGICYGMIRQFSGKLYMMSYSQTSGVGTVYVLACSFGVDYTNGSNWAQSGGSITDGTHYLSETSLLINDASHWIAVSRNDSSSSDGDLYESTSSNGGTTWTTPARMNVPQCLSGGATLSNTGAPFLMTLADGSILLQFNNRYAAPYGIASVIFPAGNSLTFQQIPAMFATGYAGANYQTSFGYPTTVQRSDGNLVTIFYYSPGSGSASLANIGTFISTEDWILNSVNILETCQATTGFTSPGANCTVDTTHTFQAQTNALKFDNSAGTGAIASKTCWRTSAASGATNYGISNVAYTAWIYVTQTVTAVSPNISIRDYSATTIRAGGGMWSTPYDVEWYNGSAWQDTGVPMGLNRWWKLDFNAATTPSTVAGSILLNNVVATSSWGQWTTGPAIPAVVTFLACSTTSTHSDTFWLGLFYTHQYTANLPTITVGSEQSYTPPSALGGPCLMAAI